MDGGGVEHYFQSVSTVGLLLRGGVLLLLALGLTALLSWPLFALLGFPMPERLALLFFLIGGRGPVPQAEPGAGRAGAEAAPVELPGGGRASRAVSAPPDGKEGPYGACGALWPDLLSGKGRGSN